MTDYPDRLGAQPTPPQQPVPALRPPEHLTPADLQRLLACQKRLKRAEAEYRAALAEHAVVMLDLEPYALGPGDKVDTTTGEITRAQMTAPAENGAAARTEMLA